MDDTVCPNVKAKSCLTSQRRRPTAHGLGIITENPKFRHYAMMNKRFESFNELGWPEYTPVTVKDLVEAGLVYTGVGDSVRCFYCGGGLRNWEIGDQPIVEHARWYPNCPYVILLKGRRFVQQISDGENPVTEDQTMVYGHSEEMNVSHSVDKLTKCPAAQALIQNDYLLADVTTAIQEWQHHKGCVPFTAADLFAIIADMKKKSNTNGETTTDKSETHCGCQETAETCDMGMEELAYLEREHERLVDGQLCKVCFEHFADIIFLPCGHISCCAFCAPALEKCHMCRKDINGLVKAIYASKTVAKS